MTTTAAAHQSMIAHMTHTLAVAYSHMPPAMTPEGNRVRNFWALIVADESARAACGDTWSGYCELPAGHPGNHQRDTVVWTTTSPEAWRRLMRDA